MVHPPDSRLDNNLVPDEDDDQDVPLQFESCKSEMLVVSF